MRRRVVGVVVFAVFVVFAACARGLPTDDGDDAGGDGSSACPGFDLTSDPSHCGSCTNVCAAGEVCSASTCKASCDSPTTKCSTADASVCVNTSSDPLHCGGCTTKCSATADAGSLTLGTDNPDAGVAYDSGSGWSLGAPGCEAGACTTTCPSGMTKCSDGICYDLQNHHDHCGSCTNACDDDTMWCNGGHCCDLGQEYCGSSCIDVLGDQNNCGACGNVCPSQTPYCSNGTCVKGCVPTGTRQPFNTMSAHTTTGCWSASPCATDTFSFSSGNGLNYQTVGESFTCTANTQECIGHVGINTYTDPQVCEGVWDVYCDTTKVGSINTVGKTCTGSAMSNGCDATFTPVQCTTIQLKITGGSQTNDCCVTTGSGTHPDAMVVGISAW